jgi:hypothetical protein
VTIRGSRLRARRRPIRRNLCGFKELLDEFGPERVRHSLSELGCRHRIRRGAGRAARSWKMTVNFSLLASIRS